MNILLIRHGKTQGNIEKRYVGITDEDITCEAEADLEKLRDLLNQEHLELYNKIYSSPMIRCVHTSKILFPKFQYEIINDFRETNFGLYEYKNYIELQNELPYQKFIESNGETAFPEGESKREFSNRVISAFGDLLDELYQNVGTNQTVAIVCHGGTIMAIMDCFSKPHKDFYEWHIDSGSALLVGVDYYCSNIELYLKKRYNI